MKRYTARSWGFGYGFRIPSDTNCGQIIHAHRSRVRGESQILGVAWSPEISSLVAISPLEVFSKLHDSRRVELLAVAGSVIIAKWVVYLPNSGSSPRIEWKYRLLSRGGRLIAFTTTAAISLGCRSVSGR